MFFSRLKFWFLKLSRGWKGKKWPKMSKISVCRTLYFHLWYTCMYKRIIFPAIFFIFFKTKFWYSGSLGKGGGSKRAKYGPNWQNILSISQEPYIIWLWYLVHMCKMMISPANFSIFQNFDFWVFQGDEGQKMTWKYQFQFVLLYISETVDHIIEILIIISTGGFRYLF